METTKNAKVEQVDMKLEVVALGVSDVDRAKAFYEKLGWRLDIDIAAGDFRGVQMTPHNSQASIIFGKGVTSAKPGSADSLVLAEFPHFFLIVLDMYGRNSETPSATTSSFMSSGSTFATSFVAIAPPLNFQPFTEK